MSGYNIAVFNAVQSPSTFGGVAYNLEKDSITYYLKNILFTYNI